GRLPEDAVDVWPDELVEARPERGAGLIVEEALERRLVAEGDHGRECRAVVREVDPGVDAADAVVGGEGACALVAEPVLEPPELAGEDVVDLDVVYGGVRRRGCRRYLARRPRRRYGHQLGGPPGTEALHVGDQVRELAERQLRVGRHRRAAVGADPYRVFAGPLDEHRVRREDRLGEVLGRMVAPHPGQVRAALLVRGRRRLPGGAVAGGASDVDERSPARGSVAGRDGEVPARRGAAGARHGGHPDPRPPAPATAPAGPRRAPGPGARAGERGRRRAPPARPPLVWWAGGPRRKRPRP